MPNSNIIQSLKPPKKYSLKLDINNGGKKITSNTQ
jgi:hypothetical protein